MKKLFSLLLALMLVFSLAVPAFAMESVPVSGTFTVLGAEKGKDADGKTVYTVNYAARPGSNYHVTDLFASEFKNVMPGDVIEADIVLTADFGAFHEDSIKFWLYTIPHDEASNPLRYYESAEQNEGKDDTPIDNAGRDETVASMNDFLSRLTLTVTNGKTGKQIYSGPANGSFLTEAPLATIRAKGSTILRVKLEVPLELDNTYSRRVGEIDWGIKISAYDDPAIDNPKTGDYILMAAAVMALSAAALVILFVIKRKKKQ